MDRQATWWVAALAVVVSLGLLGCGDDSGDAACPDGVAAGAKVDCSCGDGGPAGKQTCKDDNTLSGCDCGPVSADTDGSEDMTDATPGMGTGSDDAMTADGSGSTPDPAGGEPSVPGMGVDAGAGVGDTGDAGDQPVAVVEPPTDGNQLAVCEDDRDCNVGLGCFTNQGGRHFCSATCSEDAECESLADASWTCSGSTGVCQVVCTAGGGNNGGAGEGCPDGMVCSGGQGGQGGGGGGRCKWPEPEPVLSGPFGPCANDDDCEGGLECFGGNFMGGGYCSTNCESDDDCTGEPASGALSASCETLQAGPMPSGLCALDCAENQDGCPDGMECTSGPGFSRCSY